jgi:hypothetical protein
MKVSLVNVEFPRRGKGATGTKMVQQLGDWTVNRDKDGKLLRPTMTPESAKMLSELHQQAFDSILPSLPFKIGQIYSAGINYLLEHADSSLAGMVNAQAIADGYSFDMAKNLCGVVTSLIRSGKEYNEAYSLAASIIPKS